MALPPLKIISPPVTSRAIAEEIFRKYSQDDAEFKIEKTLAIVKPDGIEFLEQIIDRIYEAGFQIIQTLQLKMSFEKASEFYQSEYGSTNYPMKVVALSAGPIVVMCLSKIKAIRYWQILMGPDNVAEAKTLWPGSLRALYGNTANEFYNLLHGSRNEDMARYEIKFFFPNMIIEPILQGVRQHCYLQRYVNPLLFKGIYEIAKNRPDEPILSLAKYLLNANPNKPIIMSADDCTKENLSKCVKACREKLCGLNTPVTESTTTTNLGSDDKPKAKSSHDPDLIGRCLKCPNCAKILRIIYCATGTQSVTEATSSSDSSDSCSTCSTSYSESDTCFVDDVIKSDGKLNYDSCVNCMGCKEIFIIRGRS